MKFLTTGMEPRGEWRTLDADEMNRRVRNHQQKLDLLAMTRIQSGPPGLIFATVGLSNEEEVVTVRNERGRHSVVDGPFPESKEVVGGFDIVEFASRQEAVEWSGVAHVHRTHVAEVRPVRELWWISGFVDRVRLPRFERWPDASGQGSNQGSAAEAYMLTSVEDRRAALRRSESERKQIEAHQQMVGGQYVRQRSTAEHAPGMWLGVRLTPSTEAVTLRWNEKGLAVTEGTAAGADEVVTGFNVVGCASQEDAISWAQRLAGHDGDAIEVRPVRGSWWIYRD
jgi:hypothetical protein